MMFRNVHGAMALAVLGALVVGLGCYRSEPPPVDPPEELPPVTPIDVPAEDLKALVDGNNQFAIDLYRQVAAKQDGNIILSPYSIRTALAMTYAGARGQTADEMRKVLHFTLPDEKLHPAFGAAAHQLQGGKDKPYKLTVANALWGQKDSPFRPEFLELTRKNYAGGFRELDFATDPNAARDTINRWVAEKTEDKIKELLRDEDVHLHTKLALVNAIYFQGTWATPFPKQNTIDDKFHTAIGKTVPVRMMQENCSARYLAEDGVQVLVLPYRDNKQSMVVILPAEGNTLAAVEEKMTATTMSRWAANAKWERVEVALPRFHAAWRDNLLPMLERLGMRLPFTPEADFTGIVGKRGELKVDRVIHQATIEVSEEGTEAAAATAVVADLPASERLPRQIVFRADRPFIYLLMDHTAQKFLFLGRFAGP